MMGCYLIFFIMNFLQFSNNKYHSLEMINIIDFDLTLVKHARKIHQSNFKLMKTKFWTDENV